MKIFKKPEFEDDSYYFVIEPTDILADVDDNAYLQAKRKAFAHRSISKKQFEAFKGRPSLARMHLNKNLSGTIYTYSAEVKNGMYLTHMLYNASILKDKSRRCVIRMADTFENYMDDSVNTSCLNVIHYSEKDVKLFFRASDMKYELLYDILLVYEFFIAPVYSSRPEIHIIASTAQNIEDINKLIK